jgi:hypothetical protein
MLVINFEGWFQCRFATDPDPTDEPWGISGPTFAVPGEPALDRIIRLQDPVMPRFPHEHDAGVTVTRVSVDGQASAGHPLVGGRVNLLGDPQFEQRNLILVEEPFQVPIDPFHLEVSGGGITLRRQDLWDVTRPELTVYDIFQNPELLRRRMNTTEIRSAKVAEATGIMNYEAYRQQRKQDLQDQLAGTHDPIRRLALEKRIDALNKDTEMVGVTLAATQFLGLCANYKFDINGPAEVIDPHNGLEGKVGWSQGWPVEFWMGGYDVDTMFGYMAGQLTLPFHPY